MIQKSFSIFMFSLFNVLIIYCFCLLNLVWAAPELSKEEYENNRIIVRVWHFKGLNEGVGHVSVQLPFNADNYVSFWPFQQVSTPTQRVRGILNSLERDYYAEECAPDTIVSLYTLNSANIQKRFLGFKEQVKNDRDVSVTGWSLCGDCMFVNKGSQQHSCASLALALLKSGDLRDLFLSSVIPMKQKVSYSLQYPADKVVKTNPLIVSPNDVADIVLKARQLERTNFKVIRDIPRYEATIDLTKIPPFNKSLQEEESSYNEESPGGLWSILWKALGW